MQMKLLGKSAIVLGIAGAIAIGSITASDARVRPGVAAAAGFAVGAATCAEAANANAGYYYGSGYGYDSYAYAPGYAAPVYAEPVYTPPSYYGPVAPYSSRYYSGYDTNHVGPWQERRLQGLD